MTDRAEGIERRHDQGVHGDRHGPYLLFSLALSIFAIGALAAEVLLVIDPRTKEILGYTDTAICALFFIDFLISFYQAPSKWQYLVRWGWLDLISSIPTISVLRFGRAARIVRILRVLRAIRSAKILAEVILLRRAHGTFLAAALTAFLLVVVSSITILHVETGPTSNIKTAEDAVWWSIVTITTVGYGDRFPVTSEGRFIGGVLMFAGVGLFATFSGFVAAWFLRPGETKQDVSLEEIRQEIVQLRKAIEARSSPEPKADDLSRSPPPGLTISDADVRGGRRASEQVTAGRDDDGEGSRAGKRLTAAGARLAAKAAGVLEGARRLKEDVAGESEVPRGPVRVGAGGSRIREAYPCLALEVRNQRDMESFDQLLAGELDLAVRSREALPHGLRFEPLFASGRMLIVPRGHELAGKKRPTLRDLARHAFVIPPAGSTSRRLIEAAFLRAGLRLEIAMEAGGWEIVKRLVRAGVGVAVVPRCGDSGGALG